MNPRQQRLSLLILQRLVLSQQLMKLNSKLKNRMPGTPKWTAFTASTLSASDCILCRDSCN